MKERITRLVKGESYQPKYTKEDFQDIMLQAVDMDEDFLSAMHRVFLTRAKGDPEQAFKDLLQFALEFINLNLPGNPKRQDAKEEDQKLIQDFIDKLPKRAKRSYRQFSTHHKGDPPIGQYKFYQLLKKFKG